MNCCQNWFNKQLYVTYHRKILSIYFWVGVKVSGWVQKSQIILFETQIKWNFYVIWKLKRKTLRVWTATLKKVFSLPKIIISYSF